MRRLTTNKPASEMNIIELFYNNVYAKDGNARYRDYEIDMDARELTRLISSNFFNINLPNNDEAFDIEIENWGQYDPLKEKMGTIALIYELLWTKADLREYLKKLEDEKENIFDEI